MACKSIEFEGKVKLTDHPGAKIMVGLLHYLVNSQGFAIKKISTDEIKLIKKEFSREQEGEVEITKSNTKVEIEIEVEDNDIEIEVKSESIELVKDLTSKISGKL